MRLFLLTALTMVAFAANSILTRLAVNGGHIGPESFAVLRVFSGAVVLWVLIAARGTGLPPLNRSRLVGALSLTAYMVGFTLAYRTLDAGFGALILFGVVQMSMFLHGLLTGAAPTPRQLTGAGIAFAGLVLVLWPGPGAAADPAGAALMVAAGIGWAVYTLSGRGAGDPLRVTAGNFVLCLPFTALLLLAGDLQASLAGVALAVLSGGVTSGLGYALWYAVLPRLQQSAAAVVQLSVPVIAILGGAALLGERLSVMTAVAVLLVLGGIALAVTARSSRADRS
ncbi:DMT family transporter [Sulfitobacter sp. D35]|uniref:DMT family transporter n=1 Tax=Sulfitobacter sp. D35 TaxID=3083252 RepID=UPI00296F02E5|nr:DMT family transporter [Sulfitobacter sp. D35]MDW4497103.1 DMT family transporter [Sulfitobacter sp. D35]